MTRQEFDTWAIGKSKREIIALLPQDTIVKHLYHKKRKNTDDVNLWWRVGIIYTFTFR